MDIYIIDQRLLNTPLASTPQHLQQKYLKTTFITVLDALYLRSLLQLSVPINQAKNVALLWVTDYHIQWLLSIPSPIHILCLKQYILHNSFNFFLSPPQSTLLVPTSFSKLISSRSHSLSISTNNNSSNRHRTTQITLPTSELLQYLPPSISTHSSQPRMTPNIQSDSPMNARIQSSPITLHLICEELIKYITSVRQQSPYYNPCPVNSASDTPTQFNILTDSVTFHIHFLSFELISTIQRDLNLNNIDININSSINKVNMEKSATTSFLHQSSPIPTNQQHPTSFNSPFKSSMTPHFNSSPHHIDQQNIDPNINFASTPKHPHHSLPTSNVFDISLPKPNYQSNQSHNSTTMDDLDDSTVNQSNQQHYQDQNQVQNNLQWGDDLNFFSQSQDNQQQQNDYDYYQQQGDMNQFDYLEEFDQNFNEFRSNYPLPPPAPLPTAHPATQYSSHNINTINQHHDQSINKQPQSTLHPFYSDQSQLPSSYMKLFNGFCYISFYQLTFSSTIFQTNDYAADFISASTTNSYDNTTNYDPNNSSSIFNESSNPTSSVKHGTTTNTDSTSNFTKYQQRLSTLYSHIQTISFLFPNNSVSLLDIDDINHLIMSPTQFYNPYIFRVNFNHIQHLVSSTSPHTTDSSVEPNISEDFIDLITNFNNTPPIPTLNPILTTSTCHPNSLIFPSTHSQQMQQTDLASTSTINYCSCGTKLKQSDIEQPATLIGHGTILQSEGNLQQQLRQLHTNQLQSCPQCTLQLSNPHKNKNMNIYTSIYTPTLNATVIGQLSLPLLTSIFNPLQSASKSPISTSIDNNTELLSILFKLPQSQTSQCFASSSLPLFNLYTLYKSQHPSTPIASFPNGDEIPKKLVVCDNKNPHNYPQHKLNANNEPTLIHSLKHCVQKDGLLPLNINSNVQSKHSNISIHTDNNNLSPPPPLQYRNQHQNQSTPTILCSCLKCHTIRNSQRVRQLSQYLHSTQTCLIVSCNFTHSLSSTSTFQQPSQSILAHQSSLHTFIPQISYFPTESRYLLFSPDGIQISFQYIPTTEELLIYQFYTQSGLKYNQQCTQHLSLLNTHDSNLTQSLATNGINSINNQNTLYSMSEPQSPQHNQFNQPKSPTNAQHHSNDPFTSFLSSNIIPTYQPSDLLYSSHIYDLIDSHMQSTFNHYQQQMIDNDYDDIENDTNFQSLMYLHGEKITKLTSNHPSNQQHIEKYQNNNNSTNINIKSFIGEFIPPNSYGLQSYCPNTTNIFQPLITSPPQQQQQQQQATSSTTSNVGKLKSKREKAPTNSTNTTSSTIATTNTTTKKSTQQHVPSTQRTEQISSSISQVPKSTIQPVSTQSQSIQPMSQQPTQSIQAIQSQYIPNKAKQAYRDRFLKPKSTTTSTTVHNDNNIQQEQSQFDTSQPSLPNDQTDINDHTNEQKSQETMTDFTLDELNALGDILNGSSSISNRNLQSTQAPIKLDSFISKALDKQPKSIVQLPSSKFSTKTTQRKPHSIHSDNINDVNLDDDFDDIFDLQSPTSTILSPTLQSASRQTNNIGKLQPSKLLQSKTVKKFNDGQQFKMNNNNNSTFKPMGTFMKTKLSTIQPSPKKQHDNQTSTSMIDDDEIINLNTTSQSNSQESSFKDNSQ